MAFRASTQIKTDALTEVKQGAVRAKALATQLRNAMAAGNTSAQTILNLLLQVKTLIDRWGALAATPGLAAYAQDQENDPAYDVAAEFTAMRSALVAVRDRIINDLPTATAPAGAVGRIAVYTIDATGALIADAFTPAQTVNLRADLDAFIATIS
jgi:hypothetical protein